MLDKSAQSGRAPLAEHRNDCYDTPPEAVRALLEVEPLPRMIWEPCCGRGHIVMALREAGHIVNATDLNDRGCPGGNARIDFLMERCAPPGTGAIVSNPPYALATQFVTHALDLRIPKVAMLLRLAFLEGTGRSSILDSGRLARVYVFRNRLPMLHREGWTGKKAMNAIAFGWFVWDRKRSGPTALHRISWRR